MCLNAHSRVYLMAVLGVGLCLMKPAVPPPRPHCSSSREGRKAGSSLSSLWASQQTFSSSLLHTTDLSWSFRLLCSSLSAGRPPNLPFSACNITDYMTYYMVIQGLRSFYLELCQVERVTGVMTDTFLSSWTVLVPGDWRYQAEAGAQEEN